MNNNVVEVNCDNWTLPLVEDDAMKNRKNIIDAYMDFQSVEATIIVVAYNRLEKTKKCVESILEHTKDVNYKLLLIDNGSDDSMLEYFKAVQYDKKTIIRYNQNFSFSYFFLHQYGELEGRYVITLNNDLVLTPNWLSNLIICAKSDSKIGMVNPVSSNASNFQMVSIKHDSYEELIENARKYNKSNAKLWHERLRLITLGTLYTRECLLAIGWPISDPGFVHDFGDDDITFRVRRAGYKAILAKDTWIHHDDRGIFGEGKDLNVFRKKLALGKQNFAQKYFGVDAWDDASNFEIEMMELIEAEECVSWNNVLGIDVRCGVPILEVKNKHIQEGGKGVCLSAYTENAKYYIDLKTICEGEVHVDRVEYISDYFEDEKFDCIILGEPIQYYANPSKLLKNMMKLLRKKGRLFIKVENENDVFAFLELPIYECRKSHFKSELLENVCEKQRCYQDLGVEVHYDTMRDLAEFEENVAELMTFSDERVRKLLTKEYILGIRKKEEYDIG